MDSDSAEMVNEIQKKVILHWNCRGLVEFPDAIRIYGSHIQEIYLKWNRLTTLPPWMIELFNVTNLYMYGNLIKDLPPEFGGMSQLMVLDLSANKLEHVPACIGNLSNLKFLLLNDNSIERLPAELENLHNLETLSVCGNKLLVLPEWLGSLPRLKALNADNNCLRELPNRLTLSRTLAVLSVCSNRLRYLPLNGFVSSPCIKFDANVCLNYLSYPVLFQLISQLPDRFIRDQRNILGYGCFQMHYDNNMSYSNIKLKIKINKMPEGSNDFSIELPRQLLKVHNVYENSTISLWELAMRKAYTVRYTHTLHISTSPVAAYVQYKPKLINQKSDITMCSVNRASYNLLTNGPTSICANFHCQQPIFTEAWVIAGISHHIESTTTVALCCCKRCASEFVGHSSMIVDLDWDHVS